MEAEAADQTVRVHMHPAKKTGLFTVWVKMIPVPTERTVHTICTVTNAIKSFLIHNSQNSSERAISLARFFVIVATIFFTVFVNSYIFY